MTSVSHRDFTSKRVPMGPYLADAAPLIWFIAANVIWTEGDFV